MTPEELENYYVKLEKELREELAPKPYQPDYLQELRCKRLYRRNLIRIGRNFKKYEALVGGL